MPYLANVIFASFLLSVSVFFLIIHRYRWKSVQLEFMPPKEFDYRRRRYRRRMQLDGMIGIIGILLLGEPAILWMNDPVVSFVYWALILLITGWLFLLSLTDILATQRYLSQIDEETILDQTKLRAEISRWREEQQQKQEPPP